MSETNLASFRSQYFLRTTPHSQAPASNSKFGNLYLRHHSGGINAIMVMTSPPKFIKANSSLDSRILFTSASHPGRQWGLVLGRNKNAREDKLGGWEEVLIVENEGDQGFVWQANDDIPGGEELVWKDVNASSRGGREGVEGSEIVSDYKARWCGWMVCEWQYQHPQLFWVTDALKGELPEFCERVRIWREMLEE